MSKKKPSQSDSSQIKFIYIKSNYFRVIQTDGVWGGVTPQGKIHMSLFNERGPIPQQIVHSLTPEGLLGKEIRENRITREGVVREVEVDAVMDLEVAKVIIEWLDDKIKQLETIRSQRNKK